MMRSALRRIRMAQDPYGKGMVTTDIFAKKTPVTGKVVCVLRARLEGRGLELIKPASRAVSKGEVHELLVTEEAAFPGSQVNSVAYIGFFEVERGGIILSGDEVTIAGRRVGNVAGFDATHSPNHLNIVLRGEKLTGEDLGVDLGAEVRFEMVGRSVDGQS